MANRAFNKLFPTYSNNQVTVAAGSSVNSAQMFYDGFKRPTQEYYERVNLVYKASVSSGAPTVKVEVIQVFDDLEDDGFELVAATLADGTVTKKDLYGDTRFFMNSYFYFKFTVAGTGAATLEGICGMR